MSEFTPAQLEQIKQVVQEANKPAIHMCRKPVLQDSFCVLPWTHMGLCKDSDGVWRCPWCKKDGFQGHDEDCPAIDVIG